jgi:hypothetical protein
MTNTSRKPIQVSLGCHVVGAALPYPDVSHGPSAVLGVCKRIAADMPKTDFVLFEEYKKFAKRYIKKRYKHCRITPTDDISVEKWLEGTDYTERRKAELLLVSMSNLWASYKFLLILCFIKREPYMMYKAFRGIYSRTDFFKTLIGPYCGIIGKRMFQTGSFIKNIPVLERANYLFQKYNVPGMKLSSNDFTTFEASFSYHIMYIEVWFFCWCIKHTSAYYYFAEIMKRIKRGENKLLFRTFVCVLLARRYSGEMDTSMNNSLVNEVAIKFMLYKSGESEDLDPTVEGDDSIIPHFGELDESIMLRLGFNAKFEHFDSAFEASFCGLVFDPNELDLCYDPIKFLLGLGYTGDRYLNARDSTLKALLRAKAMSFLYNFRNCPIITVTCKAILKQTIYISSNSVRKAFMRLGSARTADLNYDYSTIEPNIGMGTRLLVWKKFGISPGYQIYWEDFINKNFNVNKPLDLPGLCDHVHPDCIDYYNRYHTKIEYRWSKLY